MSGAMSQPMFDFGPEEDTEPTFTVRELGEAIRGVLQRAFREGVWVTGEIRGFKVAGNGNAYFQLAERADPEAGAGPASIDVVILSGFLARLRPLLQRYRLRLSDGLTIRIRAEVDFFPGNGRLSLRMRDL